jgi:hypothetical protein
VYRRRTMLSHSTTEEEPLDYLALKK